MVLLRTNDCNASQKRFHCQRMDKTIVLILCVHASTIAKPNNIPASDLIMAFHEQALFPFSAQQQQQAAERGRGIEKIYIALNVPKAKALIMSDII
jgi:hypothetical protein